MELSESGRMLTEADDTDQNIRDDNTEDTDAVGSEAAAEDDTGEVSVDSIEMMDTGHSKERSEVCNSSWCWDICG